MPEYEPINISLWCNAGLEVMPKERVPGPVIPDAAPLNPEPNSEGSSHPSPENPLGEQIFRGLPFQIGTVTSPKSSSCLISLNSSDSSIDIKVSKEAHHVIFAHRLLETNIPENGPIGIHVADYIFRFADGDEIVVPIRERFEIAAGQTFGPIPAVPGEPFLAVPDQGPRLAPRYEGNWASMGSRQMESIGESMKYFYLWSWRNPNPDRVIDMVSIVPRGPQFFVAAITLGHLDEYPFARQRRREVRLLLKNEDDAMQQFDLDLDVDRGDATYVHSLPQAGANEFIKDPNKGWGEEQNTSSSPSYVEISAVPSATVTLKRGKHQLGSAKWSTLESKGFFETKRVRFELLDRGRNWVNVTVLDEDTSKPVPCRVHFRSPEGIPYQPHGHHNHVNSNLGTMHNDIGGDLRLGQITYAYIDGTCQGWLPRGDVIVDVARGFEYEPLRTKISIEPGQQNVTLSLKRWTDMNAQGWYSGDSHVHFLSTQGSHTESLAEDLNVVNLLQSQWGSLFSSTEEFTGAPSISRVGNNIVYVSQENRQHFLGHISLWGLKKPVMPWCSGQTGEAEMGSSLETTLSHWADEAHSQGGYVISPHFPVTNGEPAALIATGRLDAIEMLRRTDFNQNEYYRYLNCGYRIPLVGGTDKMSSDVPVGFYRTYAQLGENELTYDNWCRAVQQGKTFLSGGPMLHFSVDGKEIGDTLEIPGPGTVEVHAWAESTLPIDVLEIIQEGRVVASVESKKGTRRLEIREHIKIDGNTWLAARTGGGGLLHPHKQMNLRGVFGHTSPIYVACGGDWWMFDESTARYMLTMIEGDLSYLQQKSPQDMSGNITHHHGEANHADYLERPFHEARSAIHDRMHKLGISH